MLSRLLLMVATRVWRMCPLKPLMGPGVSLA
jgi:hypothetical protein